MEYCTSAEAPGTSGIKELMEVRKVSLIVLAKVVGLGTGPRKICFNNNFGSVRVADCIPPRVFTSFHQVRGLQVLRYKWKLTILLHDSIHWTSEKNTLGMKASCLKTEM